MPNRPLTFSDYVGQQRIIDQLLVMIQASRRMGRTFPHVLFGGNAGLGKTTLSNIVANELGVGFHVVMGGSLKTEEDVENLLINVQEGDVVFIDEIHRMPLVIEEMFYIVMEDFQIELDNEHGRKERFDLPRFSLIGATTLAGDLSKPLRDRFRRVFELQSYQNDDIVAILKRLTNEEGMTCHDDALNEIAKRSRGVARVAINYFESCREYAVVFFDGVLTKEAVVEQFCLMGIDEAGLTENDHRVLNYLADQSRPVGINSLVSGVNIDRPTYENVVEPYLQQMGFINRASNGRVITDKGREWIGATVQSSTVTQQAPAVRSNRSLADRRG